MGLGQASASVNARSVFVQYRHRLRLDGGALGLAAVLERLGAARDIEQLDELDELVMREAARRSVWLPSAAQLAALEDEAAAWVELAPDLADELEDVLQLAPVAVDEDGVVHVRSGDILQGPAYRDALEDVRQAAREASGREVGWVGPFAQPGDIERQLEAVDAEVLEVDQEVRAREAAATAPAQREAIMEWYAWSDAWGQWRDSDPSTWWGATLTELDAWRAELAGHRERLEVALAGALTAPVAERERDPVTRTALEVAETVQGSAGSLALGLGLAAGLGLVLYAAATGKLGRRSA